MEAGRAILYWDFRSGEGCGLMLKSILVATLATFKDYFLTDNMGKYNWRDFTDWGTHNFEVKYDKEAPIKIAGLMLLKYQTYSNWSTDLPLHFNAHSLTLSFESHLFTHETNMHIWGPSLGTMPAMMNEIESLCRHEMLSVKIMKRIWWEKRMQRGGRLTWMEWSGKGSQAGNISADSTDPTMWRGGVMGSAVQNREW